MTAFLLALIGAALVNNLLVLLPAGADGLRQHPAQLALLGPASALLIGVATPLGWLLFHGVLAPLELDYLRLFLHVPLLVALTWAALRFCKSELAREPGAAVQPQTASRSSPASSLLQGAGGAALASVLLAEGQSFVIALAMGIGGGLGFWLALRVMADLLNRLDIAAVPAALRGMPITLISAGLIGLALLGLQGLAPQ